MQTSAPFGVISTAHLRERGFGRREVRHFVARGELVPVTRGWFAEARHDTAVATAVRHSGRLTCTSSLERHGAWVLKDHRLHVRVGASAPATDTQGFVSHRLAATPLGPAPIDDPELSLRCAVRCLEPESALVLVDSVLQHRLVPSTVVDTIAAQAPRGVARALEFRAGKAMSGTETLVRYRLQRRGFRVTPQVEIHTVGFVDNVVGDRLVIESDSRAFHGAAPDRERDYARDARLAELGFIVLRLSYAQVVHAWPTSLEAILALTNRGEHLWTEATRRLCTVTVRPATRGVRHR